MGRYLALLRMLGPAVSEVLQVNPILLGIWGSGSMKAENP